MKVRGWQDADRKIEDCEEGASPREKGANSLSFCEEQYVPTETPSFVRTTCSLTFISQLSTHFSVFSGSSGPRRHGGEGGAGHQ